ncbi:MAG: hypothetical protein WC542_00070 [Paludibacter sp.]
MALEKFMGYPVSPATGLVDVSIPFYELKEKNVTIPLQLKYHSSGRKIQDNFGTVGYGWTLLPGLKISRTVLGKQDELFPVNEIGHGDFIPDINTLVHMSSDAPYDYVHLNMNMDGQYDIFTIFLPHTSANFILQQTDAGTYQVKMIPDKPIIVTPLIDYTAYDLRLYGFIVKDEFGNTYYYGEETPKTLIGNSGSEFIEYQDASKPQGWMLQEIIQPNGEKVLFNYIKYSEYSRIPLGYRQIVDNAICSHGPSEGKYIDLVDGSGMAVDGYAGQGYIVTGSDGIAKPTYSCAVSSIKTDAQEITFTYNGSWFFKNLSNILVKDKLLNETIKNINLIYTYNLSEINISGLGKYQFFYNSDENTSFMNAAIDWWGYYNGGNSVTYSIPTVSTYAKVACLNGLKSAGWMGVNREPDPTYMKTGSLKKINYPTGGYFEVDYEPHWLNIYGTYKYVGGLKVSATRLYDPISNKIISKQYLYEMPHYMASEYPTTESLMKTSIICSTIDECSGALEARVRTYSAFSPHTYFTDTSCPVWYEKVTEFPEVNGVPNGKTVYTYDYKKLYSCTVDYVDGFDNYYPQVHDLQYQFPVLLTQTHFNKDGARIKMIKNDYVDNGFDGLEGWIVESRKILKNKNVFGLFDDLCQVGKYYEAYPDAIGYYPYTLMYCSYDMISSETRTYNGNDSICEKVSYSYDSENEYNLRSKTTQLNDGDLTESYYYPYDKNNIPDINVLTSSEQAVIEQMNNDNYKTTIIEQTLKKGSKKLYSKLNSYKLLWSNLYVSSTGYFQTGDHPFESPLHYYYYDQRGNPACISYEGKPMTIYIWGYKGRYPVAKIECCIQLTSSLLLASSYYNTVISCIGSTNLSILDINPTDDQIRTIFSSLQANPNLKGAMITYYTYKPLVGITSETDPHGVTTYYDYDPFNRLMDIKDINSKKIKEFQYHYKP